MSADSHTETVADFVSANTYHLESIPVSVDIASVGAYVAMSGHNDMIAETVQYLFLQGVKRVKLRVSVEIVPCVEAGFRPVRVPEGYTDPRVSINSDPSPLADPV